MVLSLTPKLVFLTSGPVYDTFHKPSLFIPFIQLMGPKVQPGWVISPKFYVVSLNRTVEPIRIAGNYAEETTISPYNEEPMHNPGTHCPITEHSALFLIPFMFYVYVEMELPLVVFITLWDHGPD